MDRRETVARFRQRLQQVLRDGGLSQAAFARRIGLDRSTLSQLLDEGQDRLPRAETIVAIAEAAQVSVDWLLGLTQSGSVGPELVQRALEIADGSGQPGDERPLAPSLGKLWRGLLCECRDGTRSCPRFSGQ